MNTNELIEALKRTSDEELVQVMAEILPYREPYKNEPFVKSSRMFLGIYSQDEDNQYIEAIAYPKDKEHGPNWGFCQNAESEVNQVEYTSNCKECISPFTGKEVYLT